MCCSSEALEALRVALTKRWPDCKVHLFGSTANQLSICNNNDIDVCLELPDLASDTVCCLAASWCSGGQLHVFDPGNQLPFVFIPAELTKDNLSRCMALLSHPWVSFTLLCMSRTFDPGQPGGCVGFGLSASGCAFQLQNTKGEVVEELGQLLTEAGMQNVLPLPKARVPVVKFVVGDNGTKVRVPTHCPLVRFYIAVS